MPLPQDKYYTTDDYFNTPSNERLELIDGQFYAMSASSRIHQKILMELSTLIHAYIKSKGGNCEVYPAPFAVQLDKDKDTIVEPDISIICDADKLTDRGCLGAPDWIIEIVSLANVKHDYITKLNLYNNAGVREYWIVDTDNNKVVVYNMTDGQFMLNAYTFQDKIDVGIYEDLCIDFSTFDLHKQLHVYQECKLLK